MRKIERVGTPASREDRSTNTRIGDALRGARVERGLSLVELQGRTKIRAKYLAALEEERFADLPPYPFARGFLQTVALELGLNPEPLVAQLAASMPGAEAPSAERWQRLDGAVVPAVPPSRTRRLMASIALVVVVLGTALAVYFAQQLRRFGEPESVAAPPIPAQATSPAQPAAGEPPAPPATPAVAATPAPEPVPSGQGVVVDLRASGLSWVLVVVDGTRVFEGFVTDGTVRRWQGGSAVRIRVGNAGVVALTANGKDLGTLGKPGEVVDHTFAR